MNSITKISNIQFERTEEVISRKWLGVSAKKIRLLSISDWTQLSDANITQNLKNLWRMWRQKVRAIKRSSYTDPDKALEALNSLEQQIPERLPQAALEEVTITVPIHNSDVEEAKDAMKKYINEIMSNEVIPKTVSLEDINTLIDRKLQESTQILLDSFNNSLEKKLVDHPKKELEVPKDAALWTSFMMRQVNMKHDLWTPSFNEELLNEAMDFLSVGESMSSWPFLQIYATADNISLHDTAQKVIQNKKEWLQLTCQIETSRLEYIKKARSVDTHEKATELAHELESLKII